MGAAASIEHGEWYGGGCMGRVVGGVEGVGGRRVEGERAWSGSREHEMVPHVRQRQHDFMSLASVIWWLFLLLMVGA